MTLQHLSLTGLFILYYSLVFFLRNFDRKLVSIIIIQLTLIDMQNARSLIYLPVLRINTAERRWPADWLFILPITSISCLFFPPSQYFHVLCVFLFFFWFFLKKWAVSWTFCGAGWWWCLSSRWETPCRVSEITAFCQRNFIQAHQNSVSNDLLNVDAECTANSQTISGYFPKTVRTHKLIVAF